MRKRPTKIEYRNDIYYFKCVLNLNYINHFLCDLNLNYVNRFYYLDFVYYCNLKKFDGWHLT